MEQLEELFPDEIVAVPQYRSFVNQPERIQISSQEDMLDYDPATLTSYYRFKVALPRPALDCKSIQLARASIPTPTASFPDTECTFWYYALPYVANGAIFVYPFSPGDTPDYIFDMSGNIYDANPPNPIPVGEIYFDTGKITLSGIDYTYDELNAYNDGNGGASTDVLDDNNTPVFSLLYATPELASRRINYLRYIRLVPSFAQPDLCIGSFNGENWGYNRIFADFSDLMTELNKACGDDPLNNTPENNVLNSFRFVPNDISFSLDPRFNRAVMTGLDPNEITTYLPVASDDLIWQTAAELLKQRDKTNTNSFVEGAIAVIQPWIPYRNLNLRLGFNYAIYGTGPNYFNMLRPQPEYVAGGPLGTWFDLYDHLAPGYIDLVNTGCCHLYTDITGGSTIDSIANKALLATIPLNTPQLGVAYHSLPLSNPLTKISSQLYEIYIEMRTDTGQPYYIGNNAIVSLEFILTY